MTNFLKILLAVFLFGITFTLATQKKLLKIETTQTIETLNKKITLRVKLDRLVLYFIGKALGKKVKGHRL